MGAACARSRSDRTIMAVASVFLTAISLSSLDQLWCAIPAAVCATFLAIGALTGWCPTQLLRSREEPPPVNTLGYNEVRQPMDIRAQP